MSDLEKTSAFLFYNDSNGKISVQVIIGEDTVWTTQRGMGDIFETTRENINIHLSNIFKEGELDEASVCKEILHTASDGKRYNTNFYNLDAIIAVGYRVNSFKATRFRQWATRTLKEYLTKGFVLDDERLKQGNNLFNKDYLKELLERIRDIRASEKMFYEKVKEFYAESVDYDKDDPETPKFFAKVQNKLEYAITGKTSAEIIKERANYKSPNLGLTTWKNVKKEGNILKSDVTIAKNYLSEDEIRKLNRLVNMFLDYMELQIEGMGEPIKMNDWEGKLDAFLNFNKFKVLTNAGHIRRNAADKHAESEFLKFKSKKEQDENEIAKRKFDEFMKGLKSGDPLPIEGSVEKKASSDLPLSALLKVPPPKKGI